MSTTSTPRALGAVLPIVIAAAVTAAPAQQTQPSSGPSEASWSMQGDPSQAFKRTCVGDFDGNGTADLVAVRGTQLEILGDPSVFGWSSGNLGSVRDAATLPDPLFDADTVVSVGWNGVQLWSTFDLIHPVTGSSAPTITDLDPQPSEWVGAALVAVGDVAGESAPRIVGVLSDLRSVRTLVHSGTQYVDQAISLTPAPAADIVDVALVDFHADGTPELTLMSASSLSIYSLSTGMRLVHYEGNAGWSNACMTVGRPGGAIAEWVAVVIDYNGVQQYLSIVDGDGPNGLLLLQGNPKVVGMTAGNYKDVAEPEPAAGNVDLLLSIDATNALWVLLNDAEVAAPPIFSLDAAHKKVIEYPSTTTGAQSNHAQPAFADFDNDGDLDILHAVRLTSSLFVKWNNAINEDLFRPGILYEPGETLAAVPVIWKVPSSTSLNLRMDVTQPVAPPDPIENAYIEVAVFRKDSIAASTERIADGVWRMPYDPQALTYLFDIELENPDLSTPSIPPADGEPVRFENFYVVMERVVHRNASNTETLRTSAARFHGVQTSTANCSQTYCNQEFLDDEANGAPLALTFVACPGCTTYGVSVGTVTPLPAMPTPPASPVIVN